LDAEISVQTLFGHPTIGELAQNLEGRGRAARAPLVFVADRPNPAPLSRGQQRMWFQHRLEGPDSGLDNIPLALRLRGLLDIDALRAALGDVIARHEILRTLYRVDADGNPRQYVLPASTAAPEIEMFDVEPASLDGTLTTAAFDRGFDLESQRPLRATL